MTTLRTAAQQALEALETVFMPFHPAVIDLKAALAEPVQEPVSVTDLQKALIETNLIDPDAIDDPEGYDDGSTVAQIDALHGILFKPQRPAEPVQEPVAWLWQHRETGRTRVLMPDERTATDVAAAWDVVGPLYLAPPQRLPLTEEEIALISIECAASHQHNDLHFARAVEAAHGIKEEKCTV